MSVCVSVRVRMRRERGRVRLAAAPKAVLGRFLPRVLVRMLRKLLMTLRLGWMALLLA